MHMRQDGDTTAHVSVGGEAKLVLGFPRSRPSPTGHPLLTSHQHTANTSLTAAPQSTAVPAVGPGHNLLRAIVSRWRGVCPG